MLRSKKLRSIAAVAAVAPIAAIGLSACGPTNDPQVGILSQQVQLTQTKSSVLLLASFRCSGGAGATQETTPVVWASVKQTSKSYDQRLFSDGSSKFATAWYDSHTPVVCDGKVHNQVFKLDRHPDKGILSTKTSAWLQFCLTDKNGFLATNDQWVQITP